MHNRRPAGYNFLAAEAGSTDCKPAELESSQAGLRNPNISLNRSTVLRGDTVAFPVSAG